mmetsp:Transcript_45417/g.84098  ORF Transcript_45417/g.84098 Transcript_45417/m.84098 type:complete len:460 (+) Transcript_45417:332-1711(+)
MKLILVICHVLRRTLLGSSNVHFITLEASNLLVDPSKDPCARADSSGLQEQAPHKHHVHERVGQEGNGERRGHKLPGDRSNIRCDDSSKQTSVEESLDTIRHTEDVLVFWTNSKSTDTGNHEEAQGHTQLTPNHEARQVPALSTVQQVASLHGELGLSSLGLLELGDGEERNLHALQQSNDGHEKEEQNHANSWGDTGPDRGLAIEEGRQSHSQGEAQHGKGHNHAEPEEHKNTTSLRRLIGLDRLASQLPDNQLNDVGEVHEAGELNCHGNVEGEHSEVVVDVVKHAVRSIDLRVQLSNHGSHQDHADSRTKEDGQHGIGQSPKFSARKRGTRQVDHERDEDHHELTAHEVPIKVVTDVAHLGGDEGGGVSVLVQIKVDGSQADQRPLTTLYHVQPDDEAPQNEERQRRVHIFRNLRLPGEDQPHNEGRAEDKQTCRVNLLEDLERLILALRHLFATP